MAVAINNKVIIDALKVQRNKLQEEINQLDAYIKQLRNADLATQPQIPFELGKDANVNTPQRISPVFHGGNSVKKQIIQIMDSIAMPIKFNDLQAEYAKVSNSDYAIRDTLRGMNKQGVVRILKINNSNKHAYWVKDEWIDKDRELLLNDYDGGMNEMYSPDEFNFK